jgi:small subunit ribosomal protein S6
MTNKHRYEGLLILDTKGKEDTAEKVIARLQAELAADGAEIETVNEMSYRQFSYVKGKLSGGYYVNLIFTAEPTVLAKIQSRLRLDEEVYRQHYLRLADKKAVSAAA